MSKLALVDCVAPDGDNQNMIEEIPAFGAGFTINDMVVGPWFNVNEHGDYMIEPVGQVTQGTPTDILAFGDVPYQGFMMYKIPAPTGGGLFPVFDGSDAIECTGGDT